MFNIKVNTLNRILFFVILAWCLGFLWEFVIHIFPNSIYALPFFFFFYSIVCHTQPEKLFTIFNYSTLVCSRCAGIYFGGLVSIIIILFGYKKNISTKILLISSIPLFIDVIFTTFRVYNYSQYFSLVTGMLLGSLGFFYIHKSFVLLFTKNKG